MSELPSMFCESYELPSMCWIYLVQIYPGTSDPSAATSWLTPKFDLQIYLVQSLLKTKDLWMEPVKDHVRRKESKRSTEKDQIGVRSLLSSCMKYTCNTEDIRILYIEAKKRILYFGNVARKETPRQVQGCWRSACNMHWSWMQLCLLEDDDQWPVLLGYIGRGTKTDIVVYLRMQNTENVSIRLGISICKGQTNRSI